MRSYLTNAAIVVVMLTRLSLPVASQTVLAKGIALRGRVTDPQGNALSNACVQLFRRDSQDKGQPLTEVNSGPDGNSKSKRLRQANLISKSRPMDSAR